VLRSDLLRWNLFLDHLLDETVDQLFAVTEVTTLGEVVGLLAPAATGVVQLEVPQKVVGDLEVGTDGVDLMNEVLDTDDAELAESLLDDFVVESASSSLKLAESAFVDELADRLEVGITPGDVGIGDTQHAQRRLVQLDERRVVDLTQTQQLKDLSDSGVESVDTPDPHDDGQFGLRGHVEVAVLARITGQADLLQLGGFVLLGVSLGLLEDGLTLGLGRLLLEKGSLELLGTQSRACLSLLQKRLGDSGNRVSRHFVLSKNVYKF